MSLASVDFSSGGSSVTTSSSHSTTLSSFLSRHQPVLDGSDRLEPSQQHLCRFGENKDFLEFPRFSEEEIKASLKAEAEKHAMWRTAAVKKMKIVNVETSVVFRYTLETFTETRSTYEVTEQYKGQEIDSRNSTMSVWDYDSEPNQLFAEETRSHELPGSASLKACQSCNGEMESHCYHCRGVGNSKCSVCNGTGMRTGVPHPLVGPGVNRGMKSKAGNGNKKQYVGLGAPMNFDSNAVAAASSAGLTAMDLCHICGGRGVRQCTNCKGDGKKSCPTCGGSGRMKEFTTLKIRYELDKTEYLHESGLPDDVFRRVTGETIMTETRPNVIPVKNFPIEAINDQSRRLVQSHLSKHSGSAKILQQRHMLEAIPVACVTYDLNGQNGSCWVIGLERLAYVPMYPKKCCIL